MLDREDYPCPTRQHELDHRARNRPALKRSTYDRHVRIEDQYDLPAVSSIPNRVCHEIIDHHHALPGSLLVPSVAGI